MDQAVSSCCRRGRKCQGAISPFLFFYVTETAHVYIKPKQTLLVFEFYGVQCLMDTVNGMVFLASLSSFALNTAPARQNGLLYVLVWM